MLKEIHEQPDVLAQTAFDRLLQVEGDVAFESPGWEDEALRRVSRVQVVACGTALHAGLVARYLIEGLAGVPVDVDYACEFRYRDAAAVPNTLALAISQSGETADTLAAPARRRASSARAVVAICNVAGSTMVREADGVILTQAGPEIGVASTKAFAAQVVGAVPAGGPASGARGRRSTRARAPSCSCRLRLLRRRDGGAAPARTRRRLRGIAQAPPDAKGFLFLGRGINYPIALEGCAEAQGDLLHARRGLPGGRDEARSDRADRGRHADRRDQQRRTAWPRRCARTSKQVRARGGR